MNIADEPKRAVGKEKAFDPVEIAHSKQQHRKDKFDRIYSRLNGVFCLSAT